MKDSKLFKSLVATFVIIVFGGPAVVLADIPSSFEYPKATVSYVDLNLENEKGVRTLYRRLQRASQKVCGVRLKKIYGSSVYHMWLSPRCYRETLSNAVENLGNEDVSRLHAD